MAKRIVIIEDHAPVAEVWEYNLRKEGYEVKTCHDGRVGLETVRSLLPDAVLLDLDLPTLHGHEILRQIRSDDKTKDTPVIILSAYGEETDQLLGLAEGADDYVPKAGASVRVLAQKLRTLLARPNRLAPPTGALSLNPIFQSRDFNPSQNAGFVAMPFQAPWSNKLWRALQDAFRKTDTAAIRGDLMKGAKIVEDIWKALNECTFMIADISGLNPNVMYEIGIAHTIGKPLILLTQNPDEVPFDIHQYRHINYSLTKKGLAILAEEVSEVSSEVLNQVSTIMRLEGFVLNTKTGFLSFDNQTERLSASEIKIVQLLFAHPGRTFSRKELIDEIVSNDVQILERTIDVHVRSIRKKLGEHSGMIETVRGVGYRLSDRLSDTQ